MLEPIVSVVFGTIWFRDPVTIGIVAGGVLVLSSIIYILTILLGIACIEIIKKKRYKVMPFTCWIPFVLFIGCGIISIVSLVLPYGKALVYPFGAVIFGLIFILVGVNDLYSLLCCKEKVDGVYCGYNTYYGGRGISTQSPVFEYIYNGTHYHEQTTQTVSYKQLNRNMTRGKIYSIYINPKHPAVFILTKKIRVGTIILIIIGSYIFAYGIALSLTFLPILLT